tara:strand:- start:1009 stop:1476 length:468 start_codon:yes stop_codon:yes gene_type:complete
MGMKFLQSGEGSQSQWFNLILNAQSQTGYELGHDLKKYLMLTLEHYTTELTLPSSIIAVKYMEALSLTGTKQSLELRDIGDQCLLISGLFPERLLKKNISLDYTIAIGKQSYSQLASHKNNHPWDANLFLDLHQHFMGLVDILHFMRTSTNFNPP